MMHEEDMHDQDSMIDHIIEELLGETEDYMGKQVMPKDIPMHEGHSTSITIVVPHGHKPEDMKEDTSEEKEPEEDMDGGYSDLMKQIGM